uniref:Uncharacterized protein n=1 Tax=Romanomermis culicivorax TaxID=13658 RepID=A0A915KRU8_ROMCU
MDSVISLSAAATEIRDARQRKPVNDTQNDWRGQHNRVLSTDGRYTRASGRFYQSRTASQNSYGLGVGGRQSFGINESDR